MSQSACRNCGDITPRNDGKWWSFQSRPPWTQLLLRDFKRDASQCPSGGCKVMLDAVMKYLPNAFDDEIVCWGSALKHGVFRVHSLRTRVTHDIQLFVTEGRFSVTDWLTLMRCPDQRPGDHHPTWPAIVRSSSHQDLSSDDSMAFIRNLLQTCAQEHQACRLEATFQQDFMPSRVLDLGIVDDGALEASARASIRLVESSEIEGERTYTCLSHRWSANGQTLVTTQSTYGKHKSAIAFLDLDTTYQDVVHVLRRLRVRYLWIDSLCIIQDLVEDWRVESKTMAKVYSNALFTLAWQNGVSAPIAIRDLPTKSPIMVYPLESPTIYAQSAIPHIWEIAGYFDRFPLTSRGWVYQERLLSRRVIHFTGHEIMWECNESQACQCEWAHRGSDYGFSICPKLQHADVLGLASSARKLNTNGIRLRWRDIVSEYTKLELTHTTDRLPAIEGCAEQIGKLLVDINSFGLWNGDLLGDLLWHTKEPLKGLARRPPGLFHLPTWSWASVNGEIVYYVAREKYAQVELKQAAHNVSKGQESRCLTVTSKAVPARLRFAKRQHEQEWQRRAVKAEVAVDGTHLRTEGGPGTWGRFSFTADFSLRSLTWSEEAETYAISIIRLAHIQSPPPTFGPERDCCLVVWTYGKTIPGSGALRETEDKRLINQRIGTLETLRDPSCQMGHEKRFREPIIDWERAKDLTIALE